MPKIAELKQAPNGAMWARLDIDWDGGPITIYTDIELEQIKQQVRKEIIYWIQNHDKIEVRSEYESD